MGCGGISMELLTYETTAFFQNLSPSAQAHQRLLA